MNAPREMGSVITDSLQAYLSPAWDVYRNPEQYLLIPANGNTPAIYIERRDICRDKHFWIEASEVERVREFYRKQGERS